MANLSTSTADHNVRCFLWFRLLFNARFYYPVFAILFLDFGLSLEQFSILNFVWALTIVVMEVPSGAIADQIGRRPLVILSAFLMIVEMATISFAPTGNVTLIFALFMLNRILSGAAEACASGADEALAYDALREEGRESEWGSVLGRLARQQAVVFFVAMTIGALVYDNSLLGYLANQLGVAWAPNQNLTMRFPIFLTLASAIVCFFVTLRMKEVSFRPKQHVNVGSTFRTVFGAGRWILHTPFVLFVILISIGHDSIVRLFLTLESSYFRLIMIPEALFGIIGSILALTGYLVPAIANRLIAKTSPRNAFGIVTLITLFSFAGITFSIPYYGVLFAGSIFFAMSLNHFLLSHYLNSAVESDHRATVLSFKGLAMNLAYGFTGLLFAGAMNLLSHSNPSEEAAFAVVLKWFPAYFLVTIVFIYLFGTTVREASKKA